MQVLIIRHAIAVDHGTPPYKTDEERPLTPKGVRRMKLAAAGIARVVPSLDALYTSPLVRAVETARLVAEAYEGSPKPEVADVLAPGHGAAAVGRWLRSLGRDDVVGLTGHEPGCSELLSHLLVGDTSLGVEFKKGAAALVDVGWGQRGHQAMLLWFASPALLRATGE